MRKKEQAARDAHETLTLLRFKTPEEIDRALAEHKANGGTRPADPTGSLPLIEDGAARMLEARRNDPAAYVMDMPRVRRAFEEANPDDSEATRLAFALRMGAQREMGVPEDRVRVFTRPVPTTRPVRVTTPPVFLIPGTRRRRHPRSCALPYLRLGPGISASVRSQWRPTAKVRH